MYGDAGADELELVWSQALAEYEGEDVRSALEAMSRIHQDFPPTLFQFTGLCRENRIRRAQVAPKLTPPLAGANAAAKMQRIAGTVGRAKDDPRGWARKIMVRHQSGERLPAISVQFAREALGWGPDRQPGED